MGGCIYKCVVCGDRKENIVTARTPHCLYCVSCEGYRTHHREPEPGPSPPSLEDRVAALEAATEFLMGSVGDG